MNDKILIQRCDGIEFYRKKREVKFEKNVCFRYSEDKINKLKQLAENEGIKYQTLIKDILDEYLKRKDNRI